MSSGWLAKSKYGRTFFLWMSGFVFLQLHSVEQRNPPLSSASFSSLEDIMDRAYDRYKVQLRRVQVLYSKSGTDEIIYDAGQVSVTLYGTSDPSVGVAWKTSRLQSSSVQHILQPMDISLQLDKCMVEKDARMPRWVSQILSVTGSFIRRETF